MISVSIFELSCNIDYDFKIINYKDFCEEKLILESEFFEEKLWKIFSSNLGSFYSDYYFSKYKNHNLRGEIIHVVKFTEGTFFVLKENTRVPTSWHRDFKSYKRKKDIFKRDKEIISDENFFDYFKTKENISHYLV